MTLTPASVTRSLPTKFATWGLLVVIPLVVPQLVLAREVNKGLVVSVPQNDIANLAQRLPSLLETPLKLFDENRAQPADVFTLICDFNPNGEANKNGSFGSCYDLAKQIEGLRRTKNIYVVAYVHGDVSRHSVLPVLACDVIVMANSASARLGPILNRDQQLDRVEQNAYKEIPGERFPSVLVRKMYDANVGVYKVKPFVQEGATYRDSADPNLPPGDLIPWLGKGIVIKYTFDQAKQVGLIEAEPHDSLEEVLRTYGLSRRALFRQPEKLVVVRTTLSGKINGEMREVLGRRIKRTEEVGGNVLILQLECAEGSSASAHEMALMLIELGERPEKRIETIAYVMPSARNIAMFLAFACDRIYMHPDALLGDFEPYIDDNPKKEELIRRNLSEVAEKKHYPAVLVRAMLDRDMQVHWVKSVRGKSEKRFLDGPEFKAAQAADARWQIDETIKSADDTEYLSLDAENAKRLGIAAGIFADVDGIYNQLGVSASEVEVIAGDFLEKLASFLRDPMTSMVLIILGIMCLIIELKMPGVGIPGIIAAVCFVLYFWSHSHFHGGTMTWLALLLFLLGLLLLAVEIFVIPGFGVVGVGGIILVMGALGLMAFGHWPRTEEDWLEFSTRIGSITLGMVGAILLTIVVFRYLPNLPFANRLVLTPPEEDIEEDDIDYEAETELQLLGAIGVSATPLRPAGKAQIGEDFVDVLAEGGYIAAGTRVQIVEIEGNRVVVKEI